MRRLAIGLVPLLAGLGSAAAGAAPPDAIVFSGICDASAAIALDENRVIVGDDEKPWLSVYRLDGGEAVARVPLPQGGGAGAASGDKHAPEADIEAAAVFGGRIVWMSSNGRNGDGKVDRDRFQLFASHRLANGTWSEAFSRSFAGLPDALAATTDASYAPLRKAVGDLSRPDPDLAPKEHGFNIEGLTATADGRFLLVGLRNPQPDDKAVLFRLDNAEDLLDGRADKVAFGPVVTLDLGKRGIRDIAWSPAHQAYVIAAGQAKDDKPGAGFALFTWDGAGSPRRSRPFGVCWTSIPTSTPRPSCRCWSGPATRSSLRSGS